MSCNNSPALPDMQNGIPSPLPANSIITFKGKYISQNAGLVILSNIGYILQDAVLVL